MSISEDKKSEKRPRMSDGETPEPEGKGVKMASDTESDSEIKNKLNMLTDFIKDLKKGRPVCKRFSKIILIKCIQI